MTRARGRIEAEAERPTGKSGKTAEEPSSPEIRKRFGKWVRDERRRRPGGYNQGALAEKAGVDIKTVRNVERGHGFWPTTLEAVLDGMNKRRHAQGLRDQWSLTWDDLKAGKLPKLVRPDRSILDDKLLSDHLTAVGLAEWWGTPEQWRFAIGNAKEWLKENPDDMYFRAMLLWSVSRRGSPGEVVDIVRQTAEWLNSDRRGSPAPSNCANWDAWQQTLNSLKSDTDEFAGYKGFVQIHLEDTLTRAVLLRWLKGQGKSSPVATRMRRIARSSDMPLILKDILDSATHQSSEDEDGTVIDRVVRWSHAEESNGLPKLLWLWFVGRREGAEEMASAVEQSCHWLARYPDDGLVRWATMWLAGFSHDLAQRQRIVAETARWLERTTPNDEPLVHISFLWLVAHEGTREEVEKVIGTTEAWLKRHEDDDSVRVAYLLWVLRRKGTPEQCRRAIAKTRNWLRGVRDEGRLMELALGLLESATARDTKA